MLAHRYGMITLARDSDPMDWCAGVISLVDLGLAIRGGVAFASAAQLRRSTGGWPWRIAAYSRTSPGLGWRDVGSSSYAEGCRIASQIQPQPFVNQEEARRRRDRGDREWIMLAHRYGMIPLHDSDPMDGYVVVPHSDASVADHAAVRDELIKYGAALVGLKPLTSEVAAQKKYEQANMFIDHVRYQFTRFNEMLYTSDFFHD